MATRRAVRILMLAPCDGIGGTERMVLNIGRVLGERGHSVRMVFPDTDQRDVLRAWCEAQGVRVETTTALTQWTKCFQMALAG